MDASLAVVLQALARGAAVRRRMRSPFYRAAIRAGWRDRRPEEAPRRLPQSAPRALGGSLPRGRKEEV